MALFRAIMRDATSHPRETDLANTVEVTDVMAVHAEDFSDDQQDYFDLLCSLVQTYDDQQVKWPQRSAPAFAISGEGA